MRNYITESDAPYLIVLLYLSSFYAYPPHPSIFSLEA